MRGITETVKHLLIINVLMFVGALAIGDGELFKSLFAMYFPKNDIFQPWQIITHMFMHGGFQHILFNMFALWMFGTAVEGFLGSKKFIFLYISAGLGAVLFQLGYYYFQYLPLSNSISDLGFSNELINSVINLNIFDTDNLGRTIFSGEILQEKLFPLLAENGINSNVINTNNFSSFYNMNVIAHASMVGASGCIMGILVAFGMMNPNAKLMMIFLPIPIKAKYFIPGIIILDLISGITGQSFFSPSNTAHFAHVGGALTGFIIMYFWKKDQFNKYRWN